MEQTKIEILLHLMQWAVALTGYQYPDEMPMLVYADHSHFVEYACEGIDTRRDPCGARAYYNDLDAARIVLNTKYFKINGEWTPFDRSVILHEMVHYLQDLSGRWDGYLDWEDKRLCKEREFRQREAYDAQDEYLLRMYGQKPLLPRFYRECGG